MKNETVEYSHIIHQIRNFKILNNDMINNINKMSSNEKMQIIITYNGVVETLKNIIDEL